MRTISSLLLRKNIAFNMLAFTLITTTQDPLYLTVFESHRKSLIQHCERSDLRLQLSGKKLIKNVQKWSILGEFLNTLGLRSNSVTRQVSFNRTKIGGKCQNGKKFKCDILSNFQTMCNHVVWQTHFALENHLKHKTISSCCCGLTFF